MIYHPIIYNDSSTKYFLLVNLASNKYILVILDKVLLSIYFHPRIYILAAVLLQFCISKASFNAKEEAIDAF